MKPRTQEIYSRFNAVLLLLLFFFCVPVPAKAENALGASATVAKQPLQELVRHKRPPGQIHVTIPQARVFGDGNPYRPYCSPQIRAINSSNKTVEELVVGIHYYGRENKDVGSTVTRFFRIKVGQDETHYFYSSVGINYCDGLTGDLEVIRCVYDNGEACVNDVRTVLYGAIPLRISHP